MVKNKIEELNEEITNLLEAMLFFNKNFLRFQEFNSKGSKIYFSSLTKRYKDFTLKKEKLMEEIKREIYD